MSTSLEQVERLLAEIPYAQAHPGITVAALASEFGISQAQARRDLTLAMMCGLPGQLPGDLIEVDLDELEGDGVVYLSNAGALDRPLRLTATQAVSLQLALSVIGEVAPRRIARAVTGLRDKIAQASSQASSSIDVQVPAGDPAIRDGLVGAISRGERVTLTYAGHASGAVTHPTVDPFRVFVRDGLAYLSAYAVDRQGWRTYRLDRITQVMAAGESAQSHGQPDLDSWGRELASGEPARLHLTADGAWVAEYHPIDKVVRHRDGTVEITLPIVDPAWFVRLLLRLRSSVLSVKPAQYASQTKAEAADALAAYRTLVA